MKRFSVFLGSLSRSSRLQRTNRRVSEEFGLTLAGLERGAVAEGAVEGEPRVVLVQHVDGALVGGRRHGRAEQRRARGGRRGGGAR